MSESSKEILRKAEIKRAYERLTKKELVTIYDLNYNFYMNCISGRNVPSQKMAEKLSEYLETKTTKVYEMVFAVRERDKQFHEALQIEEQEISSLIKKLEEREILKIPRQYE